MYPVRFFISGDKANQLGLIFTCLILTYNASFITYFLLPSPLKTR